MKRLERSVVELDVDQEESKLKRARRRWLHCTVLLFEDIDGRNHQGCCARHMWLCLNDERHSFPNDPSMSNSDGILLDKL